MPDLQLLSTQQLADALGVSASSIKNWRRTDRIPRPLIIGARSVRWRRADIEKFITSLAKS